MNYNNAPFIIATMALLLSLTVVTYKMISKKKTRRQRQFWVHPLKRLRGSKGRYSKDVSCESRADCAMQNSYQLCILFFTSLKI